jgi:hypothetical protein
MRICKEDITFNINTFKKAETSLIWVAKCHKMKKYREKLHREFIE